MTEIFYNKTKTNFLDNIVVNVKELYEKYPINQKIDPKINYAEFTNSFFHKLYNNSLISLKIRNYMWQYFRRTNLDLNWFEIFNNYWTHVIGGRPFLNREDIFFFKNLYRIKFQYNQVPDTNDSNVHLEAWQRPEVIYHLLFSICKESIYNQSPILNIFFKKKKNFQSILEFGCGTAPITTSLFEFFKLPKRLEVFISDIQTISFHYACFKFKRTLNVIPILLKPENDFLLNMDENVDVIFCMAVFEHLNKPLETIKIFNNILNKNGLLIFDYIKTKGEGLDSHQAMRNRELVLDYIKKNFKITYGKISKDRDVKFTIAKKL